MIVGVTFTFPPLQTLPKACPQIAEFPHGDKRRGLCFHFLTGSDRGDDHEAWAENMNYLDIVIVAVVVLAATRGLARGFVKEAVSLCALVLATLGAARYHGIVAPHLAVYMDNATTVTAVSYLLTFLAIMALAWLFALFLRNLLKITLLGWLDTLAGGVLGFAEGAILCLILLLLLSAFLPDLDVLRSSRLAPMADPAVKALARMTPDEVRAPLEERGIVLPKTPPSLHELLKRQGMPVLDGSPEDGPAPKPQ